MLSVGRNIETLCERFTASRGEEEVLHQCDRGRPGDVEEGTFGAIVWIGQSRELYFMYVYVYASYKHIV